jgi:DNA-binding NarL/FixJ family response regulator
MAETISIWLASHSDDFRRSLVACLDRNPQIVLQGECSADDESLATRLNAERPDVLLVDWPARARPGPDVSVLKRLALLAPQVLVLVATPTMGIVAAILRNRLHGYLRFDSSPDECGRAISRVFEGDVWIPRSRLAESLGDLLREREERRAPGAALHRKSVGRFTTREREVVRLVRQGMTNKEIGHDLGIVEDTVKKHLQHVYDKLGIRRRSLLVLGNGRGRA